ncbi:MAG: hypothetical protein ACI9KE_001248 [Polyangiales bacterium]|jgi:hypothetical protein
MSDENVDSPETWDEMDELEPTAEELAEAASLARAMDGGVEEGGVEEGGVEEGERAVVDERAMATASLLAYSEGASELRSDRAAAVLEDVLKTARRPEKLAEVAGDKTPARSWWRLLVPLPFAAAAAAAFLVMNAEVVMPIPSMSLIEAQASAAAGEDPGRLDHEMSDYRSELFAALEDSY